MFPEKTKNPQKVKSKRSSTFFSKAAFRISVKIKMIIVNSHDGRIFKTVRKHKTNKRQKIVAFGFEVIFVCEESSKLNSFSDFIGKSESNNRIPLTVV